MHDSKAHRQTTVTAPVRRPGPPSAGSPAHGAGYWQRPASRRSRLAGARLQPRVGPPLLRRPRLAAGSLARGGVGQLLAGAEVERHRLAVCAGTAQVLAVDREYDPAWVADLHGHRVL